MSDSWVKAGVIITLAGTFCSMLMVPEIRKSLGLEEVVPPDRIDQRTIRVDSFVEGPKQRKVVVHQRDIDVHHPEWTSTAINIRKDQVVSITASGSFRWDAKLPATGPGGTASKPQSLDRGHQFPLPNEPCASLIARVGEFTFPVGSSSVVGPGVEGELLLGINERWLPGMWDDNWGLIRTNIHIETI